MRNLFVVLMLTLFAIQMNAQQPESFYDNRQNKVIATTGLNLRSAPNLKSDKVGLVPFGKQVNIIGDQHYGMDSLGTPYTIRYTSTEAFKPEISGYWVKAQYDGIEGYLFSAYLDFDYREDNQKFNKDVSLLFEGVNCVNNFNYNPYWNWYGLYEEGGAMVLKKVKLSFFRFADEMAGYGIATNVDAPSLFIIGSRKPLPKTLLSGQYFSPYEAKGSLYNFAANGEINEELLQQSPIEVFTSKSNQLNTLLALNDGNGLQQILNPSELYFSMPMGIVWQGDIDGDGNDDYIIHYGEESSQTVLYLSSFAKKNEIVRPVAAWHSGYCC